MSEKYEPKHRMDESLYKLRHSMAHILAEAVLQVRPKAQLGFGPPIRTGFYYDFLLEEPLTETDLRRAATFLHLTPAQFERQYVYRTRHKLRLRVPRGSTCSFLLDHGCSIHPAKPTQCRVFPFWPELVDNRREWRKTAQYCPGIGKGELIQIETARVLSAPMR